MKKISLITVVGFVLAIGLFSLANAQTAPSGLTATAGKCGTGTVNLSWTDNSGGTDHFSIVRVGGLLSDGKNASVYQVKAGQTSHSVTNIKGDIKHKFYIAACNGGSCSDLVSSNEINPATNCSSVSYSVTVAASGNGSGTITGKNGDGEIINCGSDCFEGNIVYDKSGKITLTATPNSDSVFSKWTGDSECNNTTSNVCNLSRTKNHNGVKAIFNKTGGASNNANTFTLNVSKNGKGSGSVELDVTNVASELKTCDLSSTCSFSFKKGVKVFLTVKPNSDSRVRSFSPGVANSDTKCLTSGLDTGKNCYVTMNGNKNIVVNFDTKSSSSSSVNSSSSGGSVSAPVEPTVSVENVTSSSAKLKVKFNNGGDSSATITAWYMKDGASSWTQALYYRINRYGDQETSADISGLSAGTKYYYQARVNNSAGAKTSSKESFTTLNQ